MTFQLRHHRNKKNILNNDISNECRRILNSKLNNDAL